MELVTPSMNLLKETVAVMRATFNSAENGKLPLFREAEERDGERRRLLRIARILLAKYVLDF